MGKNIEIIVNQPSNDNLGSSLKVLVDVLFETNKLEPGDTLIINLGQLNFIFPFLLLPISALMSHLESKGIEVNQTSTNRCDEYLHYIKFPYGINPEVDNDWQIKINKYQYKTYLPIVCIPVKYANPQERENLTSVFRQLLTRQLNIDRQLETAITYIVSETFDNINEHAEMGKGWIMAQNYKTKGYLDVCIVDTGVGILESYNSEKFSDIKTHKEAINNAVNGKSTKDRAETRGYGISTSRRLLVKGLHGIYFLYSGNAFYYWSNTHEAINEINTALQWKGTMVALRIPKTIPKGFKYIDFME